ARRCARATAASRIPADAFRPVDLRRSTRPIKENIMARISFLLAGVAALLLSGCGNGDQAAEQQRQSGRVRATEQAERAPTRPEAIPAPEDVASPPADATVTESGLAYIILEDGGSNTRPRVEDTVTVHYTGWTTDGQMFDSSVLRGEPATFPLNQLIQGWQEAIPLMSVGDKFRFWIPGRLAYDNSTRPGAPKG